MKRWKFLIVLVVCLVVFVAGINGFVNTNKEFSEACAECNTVECQDNDAICGDFGYYYFKLLFSVGISAIALMLIWLLASAEEKKVLETPTYNYTAEEKDFLVEWFRKVDGRPDYDGYVGHFTIPEEVMEAYREKYPNDWE